MSENPTDPRQTTSPSTASAEPAAPRAGRAVKPKATHPLALAPVGSPPSSVDGFVREFLRELNYGQGVALSTSSVNDQYLALARTVRHYLMARWLETLRRQAETQAKGVAYLSAEYLLGRQLGNALLATGLTEIVEEGLGKCGIDLATLRAQEVEPGLGNGGLGRLAACFIDSLATMSVPCVGYGIRYEYGIFRQTFVDGRQVEQPDSWLALGAPWEFPHPEAAQIVYFGGHTEKYTDTDGVERTRWVPGWKVKAVPYNYMVPGYQNGRVNTLRLWQRAGHRGLRPADLQLRRLRGGGPRADLRGEHLQGALPGGLHAAGQGAAAAAAVLLRRLLDPRLPRRRAAAGTSTCSKLPERIIFQLNDTHPVIAVPELMRVLVDEKKMEWDEAWEITQQCFAYTCHTLLPEALEVWSVDLLGRLLPRHLEIIYRINEEFLEQVVRAVRRRRAADPADVDHRRAPGAGGADGVPGHRRRRQGQRRGRAALPAAAGQGAARLRRVLPGQVHQRHQRRHAAPVRPAGQPGAVGADHRRHRGRLADRPGAAARARAVRRGRGVPRAFREVKAHNKRRLSRLLVERDGVTVDDTHLLDVMVKRLHEYKRQTLKLLHIVTLYERIISGEVKAADVTPRTFIFGAKAAPGYRIAKEIIHLINGVGAVVNADQRVEGRLKVMFPPNYNVTLAEKVIPAADLSEQISLAGKEASGTGNMKFALNGALTIGTDDGANVEIRELVGDDNFFLFGLLEPEVEALYAKGYVPSSYYESDAEPAARHRPDRPGRVLRRRPGRVRPGRWATCSTRTGSWRWPTTASYVDAQAQVDEAYADTDAWTKSAILNVARSGFFSSDRSMRDYIDRIWHTPPSF